MFSIIVLTGYSCDPYSHPILLWILHSSWPQCFLWCYLHCPITHYVKENFIWSALNTWALHFIECSFILVLRSKLEKNVRYFFSRVFGILSYWVHSYLPLFWDKQISFLSISSGDSLCLYLYTLWSPTCSCSFLLSDLHSSLQDLLELGAGQGQYARGEFSADWVAEYLVSCVGCSCTLVRCFGWAICTVF